MAADVRDREALDLLESRTYVDCALVALDLDMQTRRLTLRCYGALRAGDATTFLATLTFFGMRALAIENLDGAFPRRAWLASLAVAYASDDDEGTVELVGRAAWTLHFAFEGVACEEHSAVLASLADDD